RSSAEAPSSATSTVYPALSSALDNSFRLSGMSSTRRTSLLLLRGSNVADMAFQQVVVFLEPEVRRQLVQVAKQRHGLRIPGGDGLDLGDDALDIAHGAQLEQDLRIIAGQ